MRIQYRYPKLYNAMISCFYSRDLLERFGEEVGKNQTVFEVGAGYGRVARFIHPSNTYHGIDLNRRFVEFGKKRGIDLEIRDIFDASAYRKSDVFIVVDIVHHLTAEQLKTLFDLIFVNAAKKVVILEPSYDLMKRYGVLGKFVERVFRFLDDDGINNIERLRTEEEYRQLFEDRFGSEHGRAFEFLYAKVPGRHLYQLITFIRRA